jgi:hypothetical protein
MEPPFEKAWMRKRYHEPEVEARERSARTPSQYRLLIKGRTVGAEELKALAEAAKARKARRPVLISYAAAANILGTTVAHVALLLSQGKISGSRKRKMVSASSAEAYGATRKVKMVNNPD